jgi:hypothetical protein
VPSTSSTYHSRASRPAKTPSSVSAPPQQTPNAKDTLTSNCFTISLCFFDATNSSAFSAYVLSLRRQYSSSDSFGLLGRICSRMMTEPVIMIFVRLGCNLMFTGISGSIGHTRTVQGSEDRSTGGNIVCTA